MREEENLCEFLLMCDALTVIPFSLSDFLLNVIKIYDLFSISGGHQLCESLLMI